MNTAKTDAPEPILEGTCPTCGHVCPDEAVCVECGSWTCEETVVVFRRWKGGLVTALFPEMFAGGDLSQCLSYERVGQHGAAHYNSVIRKTCTATPEEYRDLHRELEGIGYLRMRVVTRATPGMKKKRERDALP